MTTLRVLIIIFVLFSVWDPISTEAQQQEQERPIVKVIYFLPKDRSAQADIDEKLVSQVKQAQKLFGDLMEAHGFERKTFQLEEDTDGDVPVHHRIGSHNDADYRDNVFLLWYEFPKAPDLSKDFYIVFFETDTQRNDLPPLCGLGFNATEYKGALLPSSGGCFEGVFGVNVIAHELAHGFELAHDNRTDADAQRIYLDSIDTMITSYCAAAWFDMHPAFNPGITLLNDNTTANMLDPEPASPPWNNIRLRFEISDPDGIHMVKLLSPTSDGDLKLRACKVLNGVSNIAVEFVTNELSPDTDTIYLRMRDVLGNYKQQHFILSDPLPFPPEENLDVPDPNLAAAIQQQIDRITTHTILNLTKLDARNKGITDLTGLQHAQNLTELTLFHNDISDVSPLSKLIRLRWLYLGHNPISDASPLSALTGLRTLDIGWTDISDISPLRDLKNLEFLGIHGTGISDVPRLTVFKKLRTLYLHYNTISDITSLSALTQLNVLILTNNKISDVSPLSELVNLRELHLSNNQIRDITALQNLTNLTRLYLQHNQIRNVHPLVGLVNLEELYLVGNPIEDLSPLQTLLANNPNLKIDIDVPRPPPTGLTLRPNTIADQTFVVNRAIAPLVLPQATGGTAPYTYTLSPILNGLVFNASTQTLSGTPTTPAPATSSTYTATDAAGASATLRFTITVEMNLDVNADGRVDVLDLVWVAVSYGMRGAAVPADVNADGVVNVQDLVAVAEGIDAGDVLPSKVAEEVALAAEAAAAFEGAAGAPRMGFSSRSAVVSGLTASRNVAAALTDARILETDDVQLRKWLPLLEGLQQVLAEMGAIPETTALLPNYPNPFNPETWIPYQLAMPADVTLTIYDIQGRVVRDLDLGHQRAGMYQSKSRAAYWDGRNAVGEPVASGVYFYTLSTESTRDSVTAGDFTATRKLLIRK